MMQFDMVMSFGSVPLPSGLMENVSSNPHENEQWSNIMFVPLAMPAQSFPESPPLPMRNLTYRTMMLLAPENDTPLP